MARRKDPKIQEDVDRGEENEQDSPGIGRRNNNYKNGGEINESETIKNASAAGLGAIGRDDQKQTGYTSNHSADSGNE